MNTNNIKKYAPQARRDFMGAVEKRLNELGIYAEDNIAEAKVEGQGLFIEGRSFSAAIAKQRQQLVERVQAEGYAVFIENVAYTWFNRFCAIRYMELHDYLEHGYRVLSHPSHNTGFELLDHAQDVADELGLSRDAIIELKLAGNKDEELYKELLIGQCHQLQQAMPFLFEALDDAIELLLPDNLTRTDSILRGLVDSIPEEDWQDVEVVGWLYQFYISEKKDAVIGKVVKSEDIPAATQLFTPNWIVKYLVQNSVGKQWLQTYPESSIKAEMEYYIEPAEQTAEVQAQLDAITPVEIDPLSIKVLDPACGSGHILVEAYKVLKAIYEERGFRSRDIPKLILENNIFGLDIDDRAAQLSGFALMMLAREDDRRIFGRDIRLNVVSIQETKSIDLESNWQDGQFDEVLGKDNYALLQQLWQDFELGKALGSLIHVDSEIEQQLKALLEKLTEIAINGEFLQRPAAKSLLPIVHQAWLLSVRYDAVVANPPYMGSKGMNNDVKKYAIANYPNGKTDLFAVYIERCLELGKETAEMGLVTPYVWMFLSSYEDVRERLVGKHTLNSLIQLEYNAFAPACIPVCTYTISKVYIEDYIGNYIRLSDFKGADFQAPKTIEAINNRDCNWFFEAKSDDFKKIPGSPIAYWVGASFHRIYDISKPVSERFITRLGMSTADNDSFLKLWHEVSLKGIGFDVANRNDALEVACKWFPYQKGGGFRKWYGNNNYVVNWKDDGHEIRNFKGVNGKVRSHNYNLDYIFKPGITWTDVTSSTNAFRFMPKGYLFDGRGSSGFVTNESDLPNILALLNSKVSYEIIKFINPTLTVNVGEIAKFPLLDEVFSEQYELEGITGKLLEIHKLDWDSKERSWDFRGLLLVGCAELTIRDSYAFICNKFKGYIHTIKTLEEKLNVNILEVYGLEGDISTSPTMKEVTVDFNPCYRFDQDEITDELMDRQQADIICELFSYSMGCMMGRYSLDQEGLVYAHSGNEGFSELVDQGAYKTFPADDDGIIPLTSEDWFPDDATNRFREFVKTVWGEESLQENLAFVAESLCLHAIKPKNGESSLETIRRYLSTQFYKDHLKTYKKRPIYWLFSSGKQKAFECVVYLHRYNEGTLSRMRTEYVTPLLGKYEAYAGQLVKQEEDASSTAAKNKAKKALNALLKKQAELREFDDKLKHYADRRIPLDLDDGVKVNYGKFGDLLVDVKAIHGKKPELH